MRLRVEMKQLREVWSCTRDNDEADESYFVLNPFFFSFFCPSSKSEMESRDEATQSSKEQLYQRQR